ncbi:MAG: hypothetical protein EA366_02275 [Spirulina sp. DLM2.Bin59]|nr:MAG: hypothetical protein EA366_02275 [Spirulina sp. DLM2.Bin59]
MLEISLLNDLAVFSRNHCVAICATLIPLILLVTIQTLLLTFWQRTTTALFTSVMIASGLVMALFIHVSTWFVIGVIHPVTFILATLGSVCLVVNWAAVAWRQWGGRSPQKLLNPYLKPMQF